MSRTWHDEVAGKARNRRARERVGCDGLLAGVSGLDVIVGGRARTCGCCKGFDFGALGRDDLNRRGLAGMKQAVVLGSHQFTEKRN